MINFKIEKEGGFQEASMEKPPETRKLERMPTVSEIQDQLDAETNAGLEAGHRIFESLKDQEQTSIEFPPELKAEFVAIQKEIEGKLRRLNISLGRMKERFLSVANFLSGGLFEGTRSNPAGKNKFFTGHYLDKDNRGIGAKERRKLESQVNMEQIRAQEKNFDEYLSDKIQKNDAVLLGEIHTHETIEKRAVAGFLDQAKIAGTTHVGLEIPEYYQEAVERFITTGKFDEADDSADYEKVDEYHRLFREQLASPEQSEQAFDLQKDEFGKYKRVKPKGMTDEMFAFEQKTRRNFVFRNYLDKDYCLLKGVREAGLRPVCLDANATYGTNQELDDGLEALVRGEMTLENLKAKEEEVERQRDAFIAQRIQSVVEGGGKMLAVLGNNHVARGGMQDRQNATELLGQIDHKIFSVNLDRDCDQDTELTFLRGGQSDASSANSVLYSRIGSEQGLSEKTFGFDMSPEILQTKNIAMPYNGYVYLAKF